MYLLNWIDRVSEFFGWIAKFLLIALVFSMMYEVVARYIFDQPTIWAFDISYMLNGTIFLLGAGFTLKADAHVRIDFLSTLLPLKMQQYINAFFYLVILAPIFSAFAYTATGKGLQALVSGEVESVSPWAPLVWPFYLAIATGLWVFALQFLADGIRYLNKQKTPGEHNGEMAINEESL
ncbi:MAG: TRAP transporter small permease subunit [Oceanospirillaceae bacterium]|nr:TRAP transporter small permease subunit [Oceanospirillaceae bacterium]